MRSALSQGSGLAWKCSWQELEGEPQQSQPKLKSQALVNKQSGLEMRAPMVYSPEGPQMWQIWVQVCLGRRKSLCSGELEHFFCSVLPSSYLSSHYTSSLWQTKPFSKFRLTKSPTPSKIRRALPQQQKAKPAVKPPATPLSASRDLWSPWFRVQFLPRHAAPLQRKSVLV